MAGMLQAGNALATAGLFAFARPVEKVLAAQYPFRWRALRDEDSAHPYLLGTRDAVQFNPANDHALDLAMFVALLDACMHHRHHGQTSCTLCRQRREQAVTLYRGDFLQQFFVSDSVEFEEWATLKREQLQQRALEALGQVAAAHEQRGAYEQARQIVSRQLELAPWSEEAHRHLMQLYYLMAQPSAALTQYESCRQALAEALAVTPSTETTTLYAQIRADRTPTRQFHPAYIVLLRVTPCQPSPTSWWGEKLS